MKELFERTVNLVRYRVKPIWVFDAFVNESYLPYRAGAKSSNFVHQRATIIQKITDVNSCAKELLRLMGIPGLVAPGPAEPYCAKLCKLHKADFMACETMDAFVFPPERLLIGLHSKWVREIYEIRTQDVFQKLEISKSQMQDICILYEFTAGGHGIEGLTATRVYKLIKEHGEIGCIIKQGCISDPRVNELNYKGKRELNANVAALGNMVEGTVNLFKSY